MPSETNQFYELLESFADFSEFHNTKGYKPLPDDWCVVITDVEGSTKAIDQGRYKEVNSVGIASIVAIINAVKPLKRYLIFLAVTGLDMPIN